MRYFGLKWELTLGQTQEAAEGLHIPSGLGMHRDSSEQVREVEGNMRFTLLYLVCYKHNLDQDKRLKTIIITI